MTIEAQSNSHCVALIGGAVSGAEVAGHLAEVGVTVVVFEQNPRPFGKIEDGLPSWHHKLREKEYAAIVKKLSHPNVHFVPKTAVGPDIDFAELVNDWGFSAVVLANGAWRDRPLSVRGADNYVGKGLIYQNSFVTWFNHLEEANYTGDRYAVLDNTIVVGGGLASIDVAKIAMLETTREKLAERGIEIDTNTLEVKGIPKILEQHDLSFQDLGLEGCTIYYRRRLQDMPVVSFRENSTPEQTEKTYKSRMTLLEKAMRKFCFKIEPLSVPESLIVEDGHLVGLQFRRTLMENGKLEKTDETFDRRGSCIISSIGSLPEPIHGIEMKSELFAFTDWDLGRLEAYPKVFAAGNVVTGTGNIAASRKHAIHVANDAVEAFLGIGDDPKAAREKFAIPYAGSTHETADAISAFLEASGPPDASLRKALLDRVASRQKAVDYTGELESWLELVAPKPL
jgi:ferredoxin--NADP+ reductase